MLPQLLGLGEIAAGSNAADCQGAGPRIAQGHCLGGAGGAHRLVALPVNGSTIGGLKLLLTLRAPCLVPVVVGAKVTVAVHWLPTGSGAGETQLSVSEKSPAALMAVIFKLLLLLVVLVKVIGAEAVLPTLTPLKVSWAGEGVSAGLRTVIATVIWRTDVP